MKLVCVIFLLSLHVPCFCIKWSCEGDTKCYGVSDTAMSWNDAFTACRKQDAFLISPKNHHFKLGEHRNRETWISLRRYPHQFFFQSIERFPRLYRSLYQVVGNVYRENVSTDFLCLSVKNSTIITKDCEDKIKFVCQRHRKLPKNIPEFTGLELQLSVDSNAKLANPTKRCHRNEYRQYLSDNVSEFELTIDCNFVESQNQRIPKYTSINLMCNGYYTGMKSPPWKFDMTSVDQYNIRMGRDNLATAQFQCAAWIPGQVEPLLSQKAIIRLVTNSSASDYYLHEKVINLKQIPGQQGKTPTQILFGARLGGMKVLPQNLKAFHDYFRFVDNNWFLIDIASEEHNEEWKLKIIAADPNQDENSQSKRSCLDFEKSGSGWRSFHGDNLSSKCFNGRSDLVIRKCNCDLLNGGLSAYYLNTYNNLESSGLKKFIASDIVICNASLAARVLTLLSEQEGADQCEVSEAVSFASKLLEIDENDIMFKERNNSSNQILQALENILQNSDIEFDDETRSIEMAFDNVAAGVIEVDEKGFAGYAIFGNECDSYKKSDILPIASLDKLNNTSVSVGFIFPNSSLTLGDRVSFIAYRKENFFINGKISYENETFLMNSQVISVQVRDNTSKSLNTPIQIVFNPRFPTNNKSLIKCVFWDFSIDGWSDNGCVFKGTLAGLHICECGHLTHFAEILLIDGDMPEIHRELLTVITKIGCGLSIMGLLGSIVILCVPKTRQLRDARKEKIESQRKCALFNLSLALLFVMVIFMSGFDSKTNSPSSSGCIVVALLLHYFILASFHWMLMEAALLYLVIADVFGSVSNFRKTACLFAWGVPALIVIVTLCASVNNYTTEKDCCFMSGYALYLGFLLPVAAVTLINLVVFVLVFRVVLSLLNKEETSPTMKKIKKGVTLFMLLGLSWISAWFMMIEELKIVFSYIFCVTVTTQGLFLFYCSITVEGSIRSALQQWVPRLSVLTSSAEATSPKTPYSNKSFSDS